MGSGAGCRCYPTNRVPVTCPRRAVPTGTVDRSSVRSICRSSGEGEVATTWAWPADGGHGAACRTSSEHQSGTGAPPEREQVQSRAGPLGGAPPGGDIDDCRTGGQQHRVPRPAPPAPRCGPSSARPPARRRFRPHRPPTTRPPARPSCSAATRAGWPRPGRGPGPGPLGASSAPRPALRPATAPPWPTTRPPASCSCSVVTTAPRT